MDEIRQGIVTEEGGNSLRVFDLEGNPTHLYVLDRYLTGIFINEQTGEVLGTDANNSQLVVFSL